MKSKTSVHKKPKDLQDAIGALAGAVVTWHDITLLARNEWICWVTSAKKAETRRRRVKRAVEDLAKGKRRPCCWQGCSHRQ